MVFVELMKAERADYPQFCLIIKAALCPGGDWSIPALTAEEGVHRATRRDRLSCRPMRHSAEIRGHKEPPGCSRWEVSLGNQMTVTIMLMMIMV